MFADLTEEDKQAFFALLDEYFSSRPHLFQARDGVNPSSLARRATGILTASNVSTPPLPRAAGSSNDNAVTTSSPPPPPPSSTRPSLVVRGVPGQQARSTPTGLSTGKAISSMSTASASSAFGSLVNRTTPEQKAAAAKAQREKDAPPTRRTMPPPVRRGMQEEDADAQVDVVEHQAEGIGEAEALYDYAGTDPDDLELREGDRIVITEKVDENWYKGIVQDASGRRGMFPASYVKEL